MRSGQHIVDGGGLVFGFVVSEAGTELGVGPFGRRHRLARTQAPRRGYLDQIAGDLENPLLGPPLARLPRAAAEAVEAGRGVGRAESSQDLDIFNRDEQPVATLVGHVQAVVWRAADVEGPQPLVAADTVIDVDHEVAGRHAGGLDDEILGAPGAPRWPGDAFAEDVLLGDEGAFAGFETVLDTEDGHGHRPRRQPLRLRPIIHRRQSFHAVRVQHSRQALAGAEAEADDDHPQPGPLALGDVRLDRVKEIHLGLAAFRGEVAARLPARVEGHGLSRPRRSEGREKGDRTLVEPCAPFRSGKVEAFGRKRLVARASVPPTLARPRLPRGKRFGDRVEARLARVLGAVIERERGVGKVVEQRLETLV